MICLVIFRFPLVISPQITTYQDMQRYRFAKQHSYHTLFVVAPPFQQLRAFMTAVTVAFREYPELLIYSHPGVAMSWQEEVIHSQGTLRAKRRDLIQEELERIEKYQTKGDLASPEQVLGYLNKREKVF